jgi:hypothetical protein
MLYAYRRCLRQYEGEEKHIQYFGEEIEGKGHLEDAGVYGRIILKCNKEIGSKSVDRLDLAQDRDRWLANVSKVMNTQVCIRYRYYAEELAN